MTLQDVQREQEPAVSPSAPRHDAKMRAVILAAGRGSRLGNAGEQVPKCLLDIGRRRLVEHQLDALADAGVGPTTLVVGYSASEVREVVGMRAEYVTNTRWSATNSLYSFWLARAGMDGPTMILNSDVLFSPQVLERLLAVEGDAVAFDSTSGLAREQMKVRVVDGRLVDIAKDLPPEEVSGENVGILKLGSDTLAEVIRRAENSIQAGRGEKAWLGSALREVLAERPVAAVDVAGLPWVEIDFPTDLDRARREVWPRIAGSPPRSRVPAKIVTWGLVPLLVLSLFLGLLRLRPAERTWEVLTPEGAGVADFRLGERERAWWFVPAGETARVHALGPGPLRVDTRLLDPRPEEGQYVLELVQNGRRVDWYAFRTEPSQTYTHPEWTVGKRERTTHVLPEGSHVVELRLVAPTDHPFLLRVRRLESADED